MKIKVNSEDLKKIKNLLLVKEMNIAAADALMEYSYYTNNESSSDVIEDLKEFLDLNLSNEEDKTFWDKFIFPCIQEINEDKYLSNPYLKMVHPTPLKDKGYSLEYLSYKPYQIFPYKDINIHEDYRETSSIGYFKKSYEYLAILKNNNVWMSLDPNEINTMEGPIKNAKGRVLAFGLGLGYFPFMVSLKDNAKSVTIIEKDPEIISIFKKHLLMHFPHIEKIHIIQDDAFNYLRNNNVDELYDYLYADIWHNAEDGLPLFIRFYDLLKDKKVKVEYWLIESIIAMLRRCLLTVIEESLNGANDSNYQRSKNEYDKIINHLYFKTKNLRFNSYQEILDILSKDNLLKLI